MDVKAALLSLAAMFMTAPAAWTPAGTLHHHQNPRELLSSIHLLRPLSGSGGRPAGGVTCASWQFGVETHNVREWTTVPRSCESYVGNYMLGDRYRQDSAVVAAEAAAYAEGLQLGNDGKDAWVFDIDETSLSILPYYARHGFGVEPYNATSSNEWVDLGIAPALPESLKLYRKLLSLGFKVVFLTGRPEERRNITVVNLKRAGFKKWEKLLLRGEGMDGTAVAFKSSERAKLVETGFRIVGNIGDQWSDILGSPEGARTFKLPDPMYYIS
ncbi:hypothetical protein Cni_G17887 [Canna indica]|uniref:Acid phosphatase n=1 Tax=Canna indica TaxID=4628 RepID=A0AAQ3QFK1_9LILI|nr:hypothetical protein Cni_G17887 [Canna indica]